MKSIFSRRRKTALLNPRRPSYPLSLDLSVVIRCGSYPACTPVVTAWPLSVRTVVEQPPSVARRMIAPRVESRMVRISYSLVVSVCYSKRNRRLSVCHANCSASRSRRRAVGGAWLPLACRGQRAIIGASHSGAATTRATAGDWNWLYDFYVCAPK
jgi:hypothetical protein